MSCQYQEDHREVSEAIAGLSGQKCSLGKVKFSYIGIDEFVNGCKNVLMSLDIIKCSWPVFFYPENISKVMGRCERT